MQGKPDIAVGTAVAAVGAAIAFASRNFEPVIGSVYGPGLFPAILGIGMTVCGLLVAFRQLAGGADRTPLDAGAEGGPAEADAPERPNLAALAWVVVGTAASIWLLAPLGFVAYCTILLGGMLVLLGVRLLPAALLSLAFTSGVYAVFVHGLLVPLPAGILSPIIG